MLTAGIVSVAGGNGEHPSDSSDSLENPEQPPFSPLSTASSRSSTRTSDTGKNQQGSPKCTVTHVAEAKSSHTPLAHSGLSSDREMDAVNVVQSVRVLFPHLS